MEAQKFLEDLWRSMCGLPEKEPQQLPSIEDLRESEWSPAFEQCMRNRLIMGAFRYGLLRDPGKPQYNRMKSIAQRAAIYEENGNLEILVDIANLALLEFVEGVHPKRHFKALDDGIHTDKI